MKRIISLVLVILISTSLFPVCGFAADMEETTVAYFEDGSYMTEMIYVVPTRATQSVSGTKVKSYYDSDGVMSWQASLTGTFTYTGSSATCTSASCSVTIYNSAWYTISKSATKSGNTASASVTMGKKLLGITVSQVPASISLQCDANGNLS